MRNSIFLRAMSALLFMGAAGAAIGLLSAQSGTIRFVPPDLEDTSWLQARREAQLKAATRASVFHDFQFTDRIGESGISFRHRIAMVLVSNLSEKRAVRYLALKLTGTASNRDGLGAVVKVTVGGATYTKVMDGKSGYLSQSAYPLYFGLAGAEAVESIEVAWPSGRRQRVEPPITLNSVIEVREPEEGTKGQ